MVTSYNLENGLPVFQALSSEIRVKALTLISQQNGISPKQIAALLQIPVSTLTPHLHILCDCGLICMTNCKSSHGGQKQCQLLNTPDQLMISLKSSVPGHSMYKTEIPIGSYGRFEINPTCGLATPTSFIGQLDEPRYFAHPNRLQAEILWFTSGYLEYILPNFIPRGSTICELTISMELSSEAPRFNDNWPSDITLWFTSGYLEYILPNFIPRGSTICELTISMELSSEAPRFNDNWPSDITFSLNDTLLGTWTSPGDYGDRPGHLNPNWWYPFLNQYGLLKRLTINQQGTFLDDELLSEVTTEQLSLTDQSVLFFRIAVPENARHVGGCTLFGRSFGDYRQNIQIEISYEKQV